MDPLQLTKGKLWSLSAAALPFRIKGEERLGAVCAWLNVQWQMISVWYAPSCPTGQPAPPLFYNVPTRLPWTYHLISSEWLPPANGCSKFAHPGPPGSKGEGAEEEEMKWVIIRPKVGPKQWQMGGWVWEVFAVLCCKCEWLTAAEFSLVWSEL